MLDEGKIVSDLLFGGMLMVFPHVFQPTLGTKSYSFLSSFTVSSEKDRTGFPGWVSINWGTAKMEGL